MKKMQFIIFTVFALYTAALNAQKLKPSEPAKGHYKTLQEFSVSPKLGQEKIDSIKFPYDQSLALKRLSTGPYYLKQVKAEDFKIPSPPANSSEQTRAELNYLLNLQKKRSKLDIESSLIMAGIYYNIKTRPEDSSYNHYRNNLFHIGRSVGTWFNPTNLPLTAELMAHVWQDANYFIWALKYKYLRVRPYELEPQLDNLEQTNWAAYPSGHAANSYVNAYIYRELAPEFAEIFLKDAFDMAHSREILGVHYPSDSEASRQLASQLVKLLFKNENFVHDFALVKKEWADRAKESFDKPSSTGNSVNVKSSTTCGQPSTSKSLCQ